MGSIDDKALESALKPIFEAKDAHTKSLAQVKKCISKNSQSPALAALVSSNGLDTFAKRAHQFLSSGALEVEIADPSKAPLTKTPSAKSTSAKTPSAQTSSTPPPSVAPSSSHAPSIIPPGEPAVTQAASPSVRPSSSSDSAQKISAETPKAAAKVTKASTAPDETTKLSTTLLELDYATQHRILSSTQALLEQACFEFAERALPSILEQNGWDCAAALELDVVAKAMRRNEQENNQNLKLKSKPMGDVLVDVSEIRHTAVHRHRMSARQLARLLRTAVDFLKALDDTRRLEQIGELYGQVQTLLLQLDADVSQTQSKLKKEEDEIDRQIKELERKRQMLHQRTATCLDKIQTSTGTRLGQALERTMPPNCTGEMLWARSGQYLIGVMSTAFVVMACLLLWI